MKGGEPIASGAQGCIFYPKLSRETSNGKIIGKSNATNVNKISKVFFDKPTFESEKEILSSVGELTGGIGVIGTADHFYEAQGLNAPNYASLREKIGLGSGCETVLESIDTGKQIYIFEQNKILGDIRNFKKTQPFVMHPFEFFRNAYNALIILNANRIVHLDMADRNIFYNAEGALIGDFGFSINFNKPTSDHDLMKFSKKIGKIEDDMWVSIFDTEHCTPEAALAILFWANWDKKDRLLADIRRKTQTEIKRNEMYDEYNAIHNALNTTKFAARGIFIIDGTIYERYLDVVTNAETIHDRNVFKDYMREIVLMSDKKRFVREIAPLLNFPERTKLELIRDVWFGNDFDAPLRLAAAVAAAEDAAAPPAAAAAAAPYAAAAAAAAPNAPNLSPENLQLLSEINEKLDEMDASENERQIVLTIQDKNDILRVLASEKAAKYQFQLRVIDQKQLNALTSIHQRKQEANARFMSFFGKKGGKTRRQRQHKRKTHLRRQNTRKTRRIH